MEQEIVEEPEAQLPLDVPGDDTPAEPAATEGDTAPSGDDPTAEPEKSGFQKRIDQLTRKNYQSESRVTQAETQEAYERGLRVAAEARVKELESPAVDASTEVIDRDNYGTEDEYIQALVAQGVAKGTEKAKTELRVEFQQAGVQKTIDEKNMERTKQLSDAATEHPEILEVPITSLDWTESLLQAMDGPNLPIVALELAKNPAEFARINALPPSQQGREIAILEARLTAKPQQKTKTGAPDPPENDIGPGVGSPQPKKLEEMTTKEQLAHWDNQERIRRGIPTI